MPEKKAVPKISQVMTAADGSLAGVLYSNGRVFLWYYTDKMNGMGFWKEMVYPDLNVES
jgi:hypothetical protein